MKQVGVAVIGAGYIGHYHARGLRERLPGRPNLPQEAGREGAPSDGEEGGGEPASGTKHATLYPGAVAARRGAALPYGASVLPG